MSLRPSRGGSERLKSGRAGIHDTDGHAMTFGARVLTTALPFANAAGSAAVTGGMIKPVG